MKMLVVKFWAMLCVVTSWQTMGMETMASSLGKGQRVTSVTELPDGRGFIADLEVIEQTTLYGPDINELRITARFVLRQLLNLVSQMRVRERISRT